MPERFELVSPYQLAGDQPVATQALAEGVLRGDRAQTLLGVTGSGKTMAMARVVELVQKPTLVLCHNKTLAAQLCAEFRDFFPNNAVEFFVSYFDYYQPEAYIAHTDTYIEKDSSINDEIERLRHSATQSLLTRPDTLIVASVSCIYGLGSPSDYMEMSLRVAVGDEFDRDVLLRRLVDMQYRRNDLNLVRGTFRVRGDTLEFVAVDEELVHRIEFFGDEIEAINVVNLLTGEYVESKDEMTIFPAKHFITPDEKLRRAVVSIEEELEQRLKFFRPRHAARGRLLQRGRELLAPPRRPRARRDAVVSARLLFQGLAALRRRVARLDSAGPRHVCRRQGAQRKSRRARLPPAERARQPPAHLRRVR
jgi:excinuclease ABC subunit B